METWSLLNREELSYELFPVITRELLTGSRAEMLFTQYSDVDKILECGPKIVHVHNSSHDGEGLDNFIMCPCDEYPGFVKVRDHRGRLLLPKV